MDSNQMDVDQGFENSVQRFGDKMKISLLHPMTVAACMDLYTQMHSLCISDTEHDSWSDFSSNDPSRLVGYPLISHVINKKMEEYVETIASNMPKEYEECLIYYTSNWNDFREKSKKFSSILYYLNLQFIRRTPEAETVEDIALRKWHKCLFVPMNETISSSIITMLNRSRKGENINTNVLRAFIESFVEMTNLDLSEDYDDELLYKNILNQSTEYYKGDAELSFQSFVIEQKSFVKYMEYVRDKLVAEELLIQFFPKKIQQNLMKICYDVLISKYSNDFGTEFKVWLVNDQTDHFELMYSLAERSVEVQGTLSNTLESHIEEVGLKAMKNFTDATTNDPRPYIESLLSLYFKFNNLVNDYLKRAGCYLFALEKSFVKVVNSNGGVKENGNLSKVAKMLCAYCHFLLKKSPKNNKNVDDDIDDALEKAMIIFKYIDDKDVFEDSYRGLLADRLVSEQSISYDAEELMISKLKSVCGNDFTNRIFSMYRDIQLSRDLKEKFRKRCTQVPFDLNIRILSQSAWIYTQGHDFKLAPQLASSVQHFTDFYNITFPKRKLMWLHKLSKGDLDMNCSRRKYIVTANTFQMTILLLFNEQTSYTIDQLNEYTGIEMNQLHKQLDSMMVKNKILLKTDNIISINDEFEGPKVRIDIAGKVSFERKPPTQTTEHRIELDRQSLMETIIVRIMKSKKTSTHIDLVAQLLSDLDKRFQPKPSLIKRTIERLVDKDYLERDKNNQSIYHYKA